MKKVHKNIYRVLLLTLVSLSQGSDFDNWYFDFLDGGFMSVGLIYPADSDQHKWTVLVESSGKLTKEGDKFVVSGEFYYHGYEERKDSYTTVWSKVNDSN